MGFKTVNQYNEEKFGGYFLLRNDKDYADVIFLYQGVSDVLVADVHYVKSAEYSGYVHCCGKGCPACGRGIRTQTKLFIPVYNIQANEIQFFDRTMRFEPQLQQDVFSKYPNPSDYVFRITRNGAAGDVNTTYSIVAIGRNTYKSYAQILAENNATMPEYYNNVCKELTSAELHRMLSEGDRSNNGFSANDDYSATYGATPRAAAPAPASSIPEPPSIGLPTYSAPPEYVPDEGEFSGDDDLGEPQF
ncbi:MAG: hypothetical protein J6I97_09435 [Agathobacter sp.]|nr:hypothetical protein [Agathobacter sp.]